ncbi:hypothetical protein BHE74_00005518 [Ensete ventricosum]|nr:hypothetical protein GW17_00012232 [Ensete ventricosum]RWW85768.1 hypothetical protein BHE74_00005518 [Ensete ventricosum]RZR83691.1 hypothetical protein BHM03_00010373 [Ensete ventricosum]
MSQFEFEACNKADLYRGADRGNDPAPPPARRGGSTQAVPVRRRSGGLRLRSHRDGRLTPRPWPVYSPSNDEYYVDVWMLAISGSTSSSGCWRTAVSRPSGGRTTFTYRSAGRSPTPT